MCKVMFFFDDVVELFWYMLRMFFCSWILKWLFRFWFWGMLILKCIYFCGLVVIEFEEIIFVLDDFNDN